MDSEKLKRLMEISGLFEVDDESSGSEWSLTEMNKQDKSLKSATKVIESESELSICSTLSESILHPVFDEYVASNIEEIPQTTDPSQSDLEIFFRIDHEIQDSESEITSSTHNMDSLLINSRTGFFVNAFESSPAPSIEYRLQHAKRQLINPITGILEDNFEPNRSNVITKRKLINPVSGIFEDVNDTEVENKTNIGKKKRKMEKLWTRNKAKRNRLIHHTRRDIPKSRCTCNEKVTELEAEEVFRQFINLPSHTEQNIYLQVCIKEDIVQRHRPRYRYSRL